MSARREGRFEHGLVCFRLGEDLYALDIQLVSEINQQIDLTPARTAPEFVLGLVNLRGQIVTVLDLGERIGLGATLVGDQSCLVVLKTNSELKQANVPHLTTGPDKIALLVTAIADVVRPDPDQIERPPANLNGVARSMLTGVCKTATEPIGILAPGPVLAGPAELAL